MAVSEILDDYPLLKEIHIKAALAFAARREEIMKSPMIFHANKIFLSANT